MMMMMMMTAAAAAVKMKALFLILSFNRYLSLTMKACLMLTSMPWMNMETILTINTLVRLTVIVRDKPEESSLLPRRGG
jgi:hypothetical protein